RARGQRGGAAAAVRKGQAQALLRARLREARPARRILEPGGPRPLSPRKHAREAIARRAFPLATDLLEERRLLGDIDRLLDARPAGGAQRHARRSARAVPGRVDEL